MGSTPSHPTLRPVTPSPSAAPLHFTRTPHITPIAPWRPFVSALQQTTHDLLRRTPPCNASPSTNLLNPPRRRGVASQGLTASSEPFTPLGTRTPSLDPRTPSAHHTSFCIPPPTHVCSRRTSNEAQSTDCAGTAVALRNGVKIPSGVQACGGWRRWCRQVMSDHPANPIPLRRRIRPHHWRLLPQAVCD